MARRRSVPERRRKVRATRRKVESARALEQRERYNENYYPELRRKLQLFRRNWMQKRRLITMQELAWEFRLSRRQLYTILKTARTSYVRAEMMDLRLTQLDEGFRQGLGYWRRVKRERLRKLYGPLTAHGGDPVSDKDTTGGN